MNKEQSKFKWNDDKVIDFVNWYIQEQKIDFRHTLENQTILESFKEDYNLLHMKKKIPFTVRLHWIKNYVCMIFTKVMIRFGKKYDESVIPEGCYCYTPDIEKNKKSKKPYPYYIIPCPYYKTLGKNKNGCRFLGEITDDMVFDDQCKICNINWGIFDDCPEN